MTITKPSEEITQRMLPKSISVVQWNLTYTSNMTMTKPSKEITQGMIPMEFNIHIFRIHPWFIYLQTYSYFYNTLVKGQFYTCKPIIKTLMLYPLMLKFSSAILCIEPTLKLQAIHHSF